MVLKLKMGVQKGDYNRTVEAFEKLQEVFGTLEAGGIGNGST
jgi:hypothetical protein